MIKHLLSVFLLIGSFQVFGQQAIKGFIVDYSTNQPIIGATVTLLPQNLSTQTNERGFFSLKTAGDDNYLTVDVIGYFSKTFSVHEWEAKPIASLTAKQVSLEDVTVVANSINPNKSFGKTDIALRGVNNSQELLRIIPGLFIGQHQGGGKAEQIFLRGFDADHGTDVRLSVDGLPINMVSHAHGQGFADTHFIIPETIERVDFRKGPYTASEGDFATAGHVSFQTKNVLPSNTIKLEGGMFNTFRALGLFNLLQKKETTKEKSWYIASEYRYSDGFFNYPQNFKRFNLFSKFNSRISPKTLLTASASTFRSKWNASGQIPERAVKQGLIDFYGAIDPTEGGLTTRTNTNIQLLTSLANGDLVKNQWYYTRSAFDLHTNFTFFLVDRVNGDQIRQKETRNLLGYNGSYSHKGYIGTLSYATEAGLNVRFDKVINAGLAYTRDRFTTLRQLKLGNITQLNLAPYLSETLFFNHHFSVNVGLRFDKFFHRYTNKLADDTTLSGLGLYKAQTAIASPKVKLIYQANAQTQFYLNSGRGFHSNDTRVVVVTKGHEVLPAAASADLGAVFKPMKKIILNAAIWYIQLQREFVYSGDGGFVEFNGKTRRVGFDFTGRYQPLNALYFDLDVNYAHGRVAGEKKGNNYIPLAPVWTSTGGLTYRNKQGLNGSLRYRFIGDRPGNEDYSLTAEGYFISDMELGYTKSKFEIGLVINNIFNTRWKETQFATETRLKNELAPVDEICFTPGTPFYAKLSVSYFLSSK